MVLLDLWVSSSSLSSTVLSTYMSVYGGRPSPLSLNPDGSCVGQVYFPSEAQALEAFGTLHNLQMLVCRVCDFTCVLVDFRQFSIDMNLESKSNYRMKLVAVTLSS